MEETFFQKAYQFENINNYQKAFDNYLHSISAEEINENQSYKNLIGILIPKIYDFGMSSIINLSEESSTKLLYEICDICSKKYVDDPFFKFIDFLVTHYYEEPTDKIIEEILEMINQFPLEPFGYVIYKYFASNVNLESFNKDKYIQDYKILLEKNENIMLYKYFSYLVLSPPASPR